MLKTKLEEIAQGAETHEAGPAAAERLRAVVSALNKGGLAALDGQCEIYASFFEVKEEFVPPELCEIEINAVISSSFNYEAVEVLDSTGHLLGSTKPQATLGTFGANVPGIGNFGTQFFIDGSGRSGKESSIGTEPILPIATAKGLQVRLRTSGGQRSNAVAVIVTPPLAIEDIQPAIEEGKTFASEIQESNAHDAESAAPPTDAQMAALKTALASEARRDEQGAVGPDAAARLRKVIDALGQPGNSGFQGQCCLISAVAVSDSPDIPPNVSELFVKSIRSAIFQCKAIEIINDRKEVVCSFEPSPDSSVTPDVPMIWTGGSAFVRLLPPGSKPDVGLVHGQTIISLPQSLENFKVRIRNVDGKYSNEVPITVFSVNPED